MSPLRRTPVADRPLSCGEVGKVLQRYLDGHVDELTAEKVAEHLEDCRRCGMAADVYLEIKASLGREAPAVPEESLARLEDFARRLTAGPEGEA